jgi:hypothetical protein
MLPKYTGLIREALVPDRAIPVGFDCRLRFSLRLVDFYFLRVLRPGKIA